MNTRHRNDENQWIVGDADIYGVAKNLSNLSKEGVLLHISTPIESLSSLQLAVDKENQLMFRAWELALSQMSEVGCYGKRSSWHSFLFLLEEKKENMIKCARIILTALQGGF